MDLAQPGFLRCENEDCLSQMMNSFFFPNRKRVGPLTQIARWFLGFELLVADIWQLQTFSVSLAWRQLSAASEAEKVALHPIHWGSHWGFYAKIYRITRSRLSLHKALLDTIRLRLIKDGS